MSSLNLAALGALAALAALVGCASSAEYKYADGDYGVAAAEAWGGDDIRQAAPMAPGAPPAQAMRQATTTTPTTEPAPTEKSIEAAKRLVIYTGSLSLLVAQADPAVAEFLAHVDTLGGYLQSRSGTTVTVRVPASTFFQTVDRLRKSGQVVDENINAQDVTKRVFDLELRQRTAEEAHKRLLKLLESATKMEDILAIEAQLRRLTDEIEAMKGELRTIADQVAFSTLTVTFMANAPSPVPYPMRTHSRFSWINQVGIERVLAQSSSPEGEGCWWIGLDVPAGFLTVHDEWGTLLALSTEESKLWVHEFDDEDRGALAFWQQALVADLQKGRGYTLLEGGTGQSVKDAAGREGALLVTETTLSGRPVRGLIAVFVLPGTFSNTIRVVEFVADKDAFAKDVDAVKASIATLR